MSFLVASFINPTKNEQSWLLWFCDFLRGSRARVNPCNTRGGKLRRKMSKLRRKTSLQNCQILENLSGNIEIFSSKILFSSTAFRLSSMAFHFLQWLSAFFNGFLLSSTDFCFPQWLSAFLNGFPLSSTAFRFPQRLSARRGLLIPLSVSITKASWTCECGWLWPDRAFQGKWGQPWCTAPPPQFTPT